MAREVEMSADKRRDEENSEGLSGRDMSSGRGSGDGRGPGGRRDQQGRSGSMGGTSVARSFSQYVSLNVLGMLGVSVYILADTFFIANGVGPEGLAALNYAIVVYTLMHATGLMLGIGAATEFQVRKSCGDTQGANRAFTMAVVVALIASALFLATVQALAPQLAIALGAREDTFDLTVQYLRVLFAFAPLFLLNDVLLPFVRNDGAPQLAMAAMVISSFMNILGDWLFVFGFGWGMFGAALATGFSPAISIGILLAHFVRKRSTFRPVRMAFDARLVGRELTLGFSSFVVEASGGLVLLVLNLIILHFEGTIGVAAYGVVANFSFVATAMFTGIAQGLQPLASNAYARGDAHDVRAVLGMALATALAIAVAVYAAVFAFAEPLALAFNRDNDPTLTQLAAQGMRIYFVGYFFAGANIVAAAYFSAVELPSRGLTISIIRGLPAMLICAFVLAQAFGMIGVWATFPAAEAITACFTATFAVLFLLRLRNGKQKVRF
ncbi:MATE family efflux transporter [Adlercreutzia sp. ZJ141]|uniref:MATE family efflux transporter n=1 Tax=Adlercreutzia sp. ZJ141 TaxID=2709406 RepID=UPI001F14CAEA|nr:MATE family efflux transporter [Adlercreutzia sp. ZJ141]